MRKTEAWKSAGFTYKTRSSSGDEIANVNIFTTTSYTYYKIAYNRLAHKFRHRSLLFVAIRHRPTCYSVYRRENTIKSGSRNVGWRHCAL